MTNDTPTSNELSSEVQRSWPKSKLLDRALEYMMEHDGIPREMKDPELKDRWREKLGLLVDFTTWLWDKP